MTRTVGRSIAGLSWRTGLVYLVLFAAALGAYSTLWRGTPVIDGDSPQYQEVAKDLLDLRLDRFHYRTIGYPVLLALTGAADHATALLLVVSILLHLASVWMLAVVLRASGVGPRWILAFGGLLLLPPFVEPAAWIMTENLSQFTLAAGLACLVLGLSPTRYWLLGLSALAFGYAALTRPVYGALGPALAGLLLVLPRAAGSARLAWRDAARGALVIAAGWLFVLGGTAYMNYAQFGRFGLGPSVGLHLCTKTMTFVERLPDDYAAAREILVRARDAELVKRGGYHTGTQAVWGVQEELSAATGVPAEALPAYLLRMNLALIARAPVEYLLDVAKAMAGYWFPPATPLSSMRSSVLRWTWGLLHGLLVSCFFAQVIVLAGVGLFEASKRAAGVRDRALAPWSGADGAQVRAYAIAGAIVLYTMLLSCFLDIGDPRQRRPTDVLVVFLCVLGLHMWHRSVRTAVQQGTTR